MTPSLLLIVGLLVGAVVAVMGLFRPFLGMLVFIAIHFVQPGELIPALAPLRIEFFYGALLITVLLWRRMAQPKRPSLFSDRILSSSLVLIGAAFLSIPFSIWPGGAAATLIDMIKLTTLIFLLKLLIDSEDRLRKMLWCMVAIGAWLAGSSLYAYYHGEFYHLTYNVGALDRAEGMNSIVGGPNELAGILFALFPLLIALLRCTSSIFARTLLVACGCISLVAISLTGSRIAIIGLMAIALCYIFQSRNKLLTCAACLVIASLLWLNLPVEYQQRYLTVESYAQGGELDASNELRLEVWKAGWQMFLGHPILGVGAGQFQNAYGMIYLHGQAGGWMNPHNLLIQVICELGVVGLAAFAYFLWQLAKGIGFALQKSKENGLTLNYQLAVACSVIYLGVIVLSLVGHTLYRPYWYLLAGLIAASQGIASEKPKTSESKSTAPAVRALQRLKPGFAAPSLRWHPTAFGARGK
jgi:O-antigen ligase